jgi:class 3 adenylate cyclase/predicted ATPase
VDIAAWLRELGLERYEQAFRENEVGLDVLPKLTAEDLKEIGVIPVGDRRRLLEGIAALAHEGEPAHVRPASGAGESSRRSAEAERRQLTVMFVDLVGSTALSAQLDPEDMREVIRGYQDAVVVEIARFEGHVAKFMGDGVLAYFGYPQAHEDDAERAVRAGLALAGTVAQLKAPTGGALSSRVGIATGLVVVGDLVGEGAAQEQAVIGDTPNLAARLQGIAAPGRVVIADATRRLLGASFALEDMGARELKGLAKPVVGFAVTGERTIESRFEAMSGSSLLPMVGRDQELALLLERWAQAKAGEGQGVLLVGEAGIGKSRISRALLDALADEPHTRIRYQCSPYHIDSALWPVIQQLSHAAGLAVADPTDAKLDKLEALLGLAGAEAGDPGPLIAALLGLDGAARYGALDITALAQRARTLEVLVQQLLGLAARHPVLVVLEDAHWVDPTTLELIERGLDRIADARVLILLTSRPDQQPELAAHPRVTRLTLNRLSRGAAEAIIITRLGGDRLATETIDAIITRTDGVPLFVEELTKAVLEASEAGIPASLHDSLMARLDRIPEVKDVAQIAAVIGRDFSHELLAAVAPLDPETLAGALTRLADAELVFRRGAPPHATYSFKHALVQEVAYGSLLRSRRQQLHALVGSVLQEQFSESVADQPEVLAYHFTEAALTEQAIAWWLRAGERAKKRSANVEAIAHLSQGLSLVEALPDTPHRMQDEFALRMAMGGPLIATKGYGAPEVEQTFLRAQQLCERLGRLSDLFAVLRGLWNCYLGRAELLRTHDLAEQIVKLAEEKPEPLRCAVSRRALGSTLFYFGRFHDACEQLEQSIALHEAAAVGADPRASILLYADCPGVVCRVYLALSQWLRGFIDRGMATLEAGLALAERFADANYILWALTFGAVMRLWRGEFAEAQRQSEAAITVARQHDLAMWLGATTMCRGVALGYLSHNQEGLAELHAGLAGFHATGTRVLGSLWFGFIAEAHAAAGEFDAARAALDRAAEVAAVTSESFYQAEVHRLRGMLFKEKGDYFAAEDWLRRAIDLAESQGAKSLELRAANGLARLWGDQGKRHQAIDLLAPVYGWFAEGFDTADLKDAKALLDELA